MKGAWFAVAFGVALLGGCASYSGRGLVPGRDSAADVERVMGAPAEKLALADGGTTWFYPRAPYGRATYAATIARDGKLASLDQRLTREYFAKVAPGATREQVHALLGPPVLAYTTRTGLEEWDYLVEVDMRLFDLLVDFGSDGRVVGSSLLHDPVYDAGSGFP